MHGLFPPRARRRAACTALALLACVPDSGPAAAQSRIELVKARGALRCAAVERPGLAERGADGPWAGVLVDLCSGVAAAAAARGIEFRALEGDAAFDRVRRGDDDLYFLTGGEINAQSLAGHVVPGPAAFVVRIALLVPADGPVRHAAQLAGARICYEIGSPAERSLEAFFEAARRSWLRLAFSEHGEMMDAYAARRCQALAGEAAALALQRPRHADARGAAGAGDRLLPETLEAYPIVAATGTGDARWTAAVGWTLATIIDAGGGRDRWHGAGVDAMPAAAPELGLAPGWQAAVLRAVGDYGAIYGRHLGAALPERGANAAPEQGGLLLQPFVE